MSSKNCDSDKKQSNKVLRSQCMTVIRHSNQSPFDFDFGKIKQEFKLTLFFFPSEAKNKLGA